MYNLFSQTDEWGHKGSSLPRIVKSTIKLGGTTFRLVVANIGNIIIAPTVLCCLFQAHTHCDYGIISYTCGKSIK